MVFNIIPDNRPVIFVQAIAQPGRKVLSRLCLTYQSVCANGFASCMYGFLQVDQGSADIDEPLRQRMAHLNISSSKVVHVRTL